MNAPTPTRTLSPARQHLLRVRAEQEAARAPAGQPIEGSAHELMLAQLFEHRRTLKAIQSVERKIEAKRQFLADYDAYIAGVLAADSGAADVVFTTVMVWHLDVGSWETALAMADYALRHNLALPDQYTRDTATLLMDETSTAFLAGKVEPPVALGVLTTVLSLTAERDAPDQARAKLHKAIGYAMLGKTPAVDPDITQTIPALAQQAMDHLTRAHQLFDKVGVKKDMERLERRLKDPATGPD